MPFLLKLVTYNSSFNLKGFRNVLEFYKNTGQKFNFIKRNDFYIGRDEYITKNQTLITVTGKKL